MLLFLYIELESRDLLMKTVTAVQMKDFEQPAQRKIDREVAAQRRLFTKPFRMNKTATYKSIEL